MSQLKWVYTILFFEFIIIVTAIQWFNGPTSSSERKTIMFSGLFPIHKPGLVDQECGEINIERGVHRWQAMLFAVDQVNRNAEILPNITINVEVHDTCEQDTLALESVLKTILKKVYKKDECSDVGIQHVVAGVIGAASSSVSIEVANLLRLFRLPQISYASTSALLDNRKKYNYFTRTVPPDTMQASAIIDLVKKLNWTSVFILYSEGRYGESGFEALLKNAKQSHLCVVSHFKLSTSTNITNVIEIFKTHPTTKAVILFLKLKHIQALLEAVSKDGSTYKWVASDYWGTRHHFLNSDSIKNAANGAITLTLKSNYSYNDFQKYFCNLTSTSKNMPNKTYEWLHEYWMAKYNCSLQNSTCSSFCHDMKFDDKIPYVIDAVYALASATHNALMKSCNVTYCSDVNELNGEDILHSLMTNTYNGVYGITKFDRNGSASHGYNIMQYNNGKYVQIGNWDHSLLTLDASFPPSTSYCGLECPLGHIRQLKVNSPECCYDCIECAPHQYIENKYSCDSCPKGHRPNLTLSGCERLPFRHIKSTWVIVISCLAGVGIVCTVIVAMVFYYYINTQVVRKSVPCISFLLLVGIILSYSLVFVVLADQTKLLCGVRRFGVGFCFSICYSALLTKTNWLVRVFNSNQLKKRPRFVTASSQVVIMCGLVFIESAFGFIGLYLHSPSLKSDERKATDVLLFCNVPTYDMVTAYGYNLILVVVCTIYAFRTRKVPDSFNEARYLGFVMYTTCLIWLSYVPLYFIDIKVDYLIIVFSINLTMNATSILAGLFGPKIYIILCRPSRNVHGSTSMSSFSQSRSVDYSESSVGLHRKDVIYSACADISKQYPS